MLVVEVSLAIQAYLLLHYSESFMSIWFTLDGLGESFVILVLPITIFLPPPLLCCYGGIFQNLLEANFVNLNLFLYKLDYIENSCCNNLHFLYFKGFLFVLS